MSCLAYLPVSHSYWQESHVCLLLHAIDIDAFKPHQQAVDTTHWLFPVTRACTGPLCSKWGTWCNSFVWSSRCLNLLWDWHGLQGKSEEPESEGPPVGTSGDWVALDSGKSFAWSAQQHGSLQQQVEALEKLIQQQGQQVCPLSPLTSAD